MSLLYWTAACAAFGKESIFMRKPPKPILIILAPILIAVAVGLVYDLQNFLQDIPEVRDNPMLLAVVALCIPLLVALVKDTFDAHGL
ncbi:hypothetical protein [Lancefieldella parvula]|uniref:hypothetical protein n=1 Tax=Lancefieldella parvula TaxID=1382 RepID=UPI0028ECA623|nr:hypothetical protein [Lancefieldella parvula]